ncbi:hypothetical protein [Candidatus Amarobacter glycogenicus]|uniref:hypothetical protein n=1 Tax=Candidatus Amarobacter glycogenicus TaxID=3140699 RepID=UPI002A13B9BF|nr:hypothetical protein [Dehalococcoidia bacterium]
MFVFLRYSEGIAQRHRGGGVVHQPGWGIFLSVAHLYLGGQTLTSIPAEIGTWVLWAIGGMTLVHGVAIWASHLVTRRKCALSRHNLCSTTAKRWRWIGRGQAQ